MRPIALLCLCLILTLGSIAQAQMDNSTEIVYASTFVPFDSSFSVSNFPANSFAKFPDNFKRVNKLRLDSHRKLCKVDVNGDGDKSDASEIYLEDFPDHYIGFTVRNRQNDILTVDYLRFSIKNFGGKEIRSGNITPVVPVVVPAGENGKALFQFTETRSERRRGFVGDPDIIPYTPITQSLVYVIFGHTESIPKFRLKDEDVVGFKRVNNCNP